MKFDCGCEYDKVDFETPSIPLDCPKTWDFIGSGLTKGVFQLEKSLGKRYTKEIKPRSIDDLAAVISLIRPGCLEAKFRTDPKTEKEITIIDTYIRIKNGTLEPEYIHPALEPIFKDTYGVPIYQEQIMRICSEYAGFTLKEADDARKAMGKKLPEKMKQVRVKFIEGAKKAGHDEAMSETIFGWIDKFSGYGFNKSHAVSYALIGYMTAYAKVHMPLEFFTAMLTNSDGKQDSLEEIQELVNESKLFNITVRPPNLSLMNEDFGIQDEKTIAFGLAHIKGVGSSSIGALSKVSGVKSVREFLMAAYPEKPKKTKKEEEKDEESAREAYAGFILEKIVEADAEDGIEGAAEALKEVKEENKALAKEHMQELVKKKREGGKLNKTVCEALIKSGSLDHLSKQRVKLLECYRILGAMTDKERRTFFTEDWKPDERFDISLDHFLARTKGGASAARLPKLIEEIKAIRAEFVGANQKKLAIAWEKFYLGVPLTGSLVELYFNSRVDTKLRNLLRLRSGHVGACGVVIETVKKFKDKNGNWMAFMTVSDETYINESFVLFAKQFNDNAWILEEGKPVLMLGRKDKDSFIVNKIEHL